LIEVKMVKITAKRTEKIQPTKVDNDLLFRVGQIMHSECPENQKTSIMINADSKDIESDNFEEIKGIEIPADTYFIHMAICPEDIDLPWENPIDISIDSKFPIKNSRIRVRGNDETWVQGVSDRIVKEFSRKKLMHRPIAEYEFIRLTTSIGSSALLMTVLGLALLRFLVPSSVVTAFVAILFYVVVIGLKRFFDWLFPYFEIDNDAFKPRKFRRIALSLIWGSGFVGIIIEMALRYVGLG
jgi:hypothetical protein